MEYVECIPLPIASIFKLETKMPWNIGDEVEDINGEAGIIVAIMECEEDRSKDLYEVEFKDLTIDLYNEENLYIPQSHAPYS